MQWLREMAKHNATNINVATDPIATDYICQPEEALFEKPHQPCAELDAASASSPGPAINTINKYTMNVPALWRDISNP